MWVPQAGAAMSCNAEHCSQKPSAHTCGNMLDSFMPQPVKHLSSMRRTTATNCILHLFSASPWPHHTGHRKVCYECRGWNQVHAVCLQ